MSFREEYAEMRRLIEGRLGTYFNGGGIEEAMKYSLMSGGTRLRPILTLKFCEAAGGAPDEAIDFACAVEMLHVYSRIHDDLPIMDNDEIRNGIPTNHMKFGADTALIAGDALQAAAFRTILTAGEMFPDEGKGAALAAARTLAQAAGERELCKGQYLDTRPKTVTTNRELKDIGDKKTCAILRASGEIGVYASQGRREVDPFYFEVARDYATNLGHAYSIRDDIIDAGKSAKKEGQITIVDLVGVDQSKKLVGEYTERAISALFSAHWIGPYAFLLKLADTMGERE